MPKTSGSCWVVFRSQRDWSQLEVTMDDDARLTKGRAIISVDESHGRGTTTIFTPRLKSSLDTSPEL